MDGLKPGRIVYFVFSAFDAEQIKSGNRYKEGDIAPAMVVRTWSYDGCCNLKVMLDGPDTLWATSVLFSEAKGPHTWHWMFDGQQKRYDPTVVK